MIQPQYGDQFDHHNVVFEYDNGVQVYGFCRDLNLIWPRRDKEVAGRNDIIWQETFLGKTGADGGIALSRN